eukprot:79464-Pelagomonas_calceolata.AAC.1
MAGAHQEHQAFTCTVAGKHAHRVTQGRIHTKASSQYGSTFVISSRRIGLWQAAQGLTYT